MVEVKLYVFELINVPRAAPIAKTTDQGIAAFIFRSAENAVKFATAKGHSHDWRVIELNVFDAFDWVVEAKEACGVTAVWQDPDPAEEGHREIPVDAYIATVQAACQ